MASSGKRAVYVVWLDHTKTDGDPKGLKPVVRHTLGWVVKDQPTYITVTMDRSKGQREYGFSLIKRDILRLLELDVS